MSKKSSKAETIAHCLGTTLGTTGLDLHNATNVITGLADLLRQVGVISDTDSFEKEAIGGWIEFSG